MKYCEEFLKYLDAISKKKNGEKETSDGGRLWDERVFAAFRFVNTMMLQFHGPAHTIVSQMPIEERNAIKEFVNFFVGSYGEEKGVWKMIVQTWPERPRVIQLYQAILAEEGMQNAKDIWQFLTDKDKKKVRRLTDIILNTPVKRGLDYVFTDGFCTSMVLDPSASLGSKMSNVAEVLTGRLLYVGGDLWYQKVTKTDITIYAFCAHDRTIYSVPADEAKEKFRLLKPVDPKPVTKGDVSVHYGEIPLLDPEDRFVFVM